MSKAALRRLFLHVLARLPVPSRPAGAPPRILLLRPDHLGDLLFMTPALHALRTALPDAHIACLVGPWGQPILADNPDVDSLLTCDFPWFNRRPKTSVWEPYTVLWSEARRLREQHFDMAVIMRFDFWWGAALARLAGIPLRIGYANPDVQPFLTRALPYQPGLHEVEQNMQLVEDAIGQYIPSPPVLDRNVRRPDRLHFTIVPADTAWAAERLNLQSISRAPQTDTRHARRESLPTSGGPVRVSIAIHPGAGAAVKLWTIDGWVRMVAELVRRYNALVVFTGGPGEVSLVQTITKRLTVPYLALAGQTSLGQLAAVFARCSLVVGADSGPLHLAVAVGTPTIHLFGPVDPKLFGPWGDEQHHVVIQARYFEQPCHNRPCNRLDYTADELAQHPCMQTITTDDVLNAVERVLSAQPIARGRE